MSRLEIVATIESMSLLEVVATIEVIVQIRSYITKLPASLQVCQA